METLPYKAATSYEFPYPVEEVWEWVSDTDRFNRDIGLGSVRFRMEKDEYGITKRYAQFQQGISPWEWYEEPYQWEKYRFFQVKRFYAKGAFRRMTNTWLLTPTPHGCRLDFSIEYEPKNFIIGLFFRYFMGVKSIKKIREVFSHYERNLAGNVLSSSQYSSQQHFAVIALFQKIKKLKIKEELSEKIASYVLLSDVADVARIRPFVLARKWNFTRLEVITAFLRAAKNGIFNVSWDYICPHCRGNSGFETSLSQIREEIFCESCQVHYHVNFDKQIEVTFRIHPSVRKIEYAQYCIGGPQNTEHIQSQIHIQPQETYALRLALEAGTYILRSPNSSLFAVLIVHSEGKEEFRCSVSDGEIQEKIGIKPSSVLHIHNSSAQEIWVMIERSAWLEDICDAAYLTTLQEFRDLFADDVIRTGIEVSIQSLTLLFTDLKGSTALYQRIGDAKAFALVQEHFGLLIESVRTNNGGIVKTIGDAVMAAFISPEDAIKAAFSMQENIAEFNRSLGGGEMLSLKIGIHGGPCFAVNLNERLDYFGSTVNTAARVEGQCSGGDIIISEMLCKDNPAIENLLASSGKPQEKISRSLKGFDEAFELRRIVCVAEL